MRDKTKKYINCIMKKKFNKINKNFLYKYIACYTVWNVRKKQLQEYKQTDIQ